MKKFKIQRGALHDALTVTGKAIGSNIIIPILSHYLFKINGNEAVVCASNMETFINKTIAIDGDGSTALIAIPANRLAALVRELPEQAIEFNADDKNVCIKTTSGKYNIPYEPGEDFPFAEQPNGFEFIMRAIDIATAIDKTLFACHTNSLLGLAGVSLEVEAGKVTFTSCNLNVLSTVHYENEVTEAGNFVVSPRSLAILASIQNTDDVTIKVDKSYISFKLMDCTLITSILIDLPYNDWRAAMRDTYNKHLNTNRLDFLSAMKRATIFANEAIGLVILRANKKTFTIDSDNPLQENATERVDALYTGEKIDIGMNAKFLTACLTKLNSERVNIRLEESNLSITMQGDETDTSLMLVMPLNFTNVEK